jgi:hypothetical protein
MRKTRRGSHHQLDDAQGAGQLSDHQWKSETKDRSRKWNRRSRCKPTSETICSGSKDDETVYQNGGERTPSRESAILFIRVTFTPLEVMPTLLCSVVRF